MIKLSLWLTYSTYSNAREKRKKTTTTKLMCVNYTTKCTNPTVCVVRNTGFLCGRLQNAVQPCEKD